MSDAPPAAAAAAAAAANPSTASPAAATASSSDAPAADAPAAADSSAAPVVPVRMKKMRKRAAVKSSSTALDSGDEAAAAGGGGGGEEGSADPASNLQTIRLIQKLRSKGAPALTLGEADLLRPDTSAADSASAAAAAAASSSSSSASAALIGKEFGAEGKDAQSALIEEQMEKYIAEQMEARRALRQPQKKEAAPAAPALNLSEAQLFLTPEHLRLPASQPLEEVEESGERWLTGIAELPVSMRDKMRNIEQTEAAKARLMREQSQAQRKDVTMILPANFNANFKLHKKEWDGRRREEFRAFYDAQNRAQALAQGLPPPPPSQPWTRDAVPAASDPRALPGFLAGPEEMRREFQPRPGMAGRGGANAQRSSGVPVSTDDRVVDRFLKRQRFR